MSHAMKLSPEALRAIFYQCLTQQRVRGVTDEEAAWAMAEIFAEDFDVSVRPESELGVRLAMDCAMEGEADA